MFKYLPNIYIGSLPQIAVDEAVAHAREQFPLESCGAVISGKYIRFENVAWEDHSDSFEIMDDRWFDAYMNGLVDCLVHSHNNYPMASVLDQVQQQELMVPSLIINMRSGSLQDCILFGEETAPPLEKRPFFYGVFDCLTLVRDHLLSMTDIVLPNPPREWEFWARAEPVFEDAIEASDLSFTIFDSGDKHNFQPNDILFYSMYGTKYSNHIGIVESRGLVLHHYAGHLSGRYPINHGRMYHRQTLRFRG